MPSFEPTVLKNVCIVLCNTSHSGNIGSTARAIKTMGITNLILVSPVVEIDEVAYSLASNAKDILEQAVIVDTLEEAIQDSSLALALTARKREFNQNLYTPREIIPEVINHISQNHKVSIVFGSEKSGLTINQLEKCNRLVTIPANPVYSSLNLAQAVQIICYELYSQINTGLPSLKDTPDVATLSQIEGVIASLNNLLSNKKFFTENSMDITKRRLRNIIYKANLTQKEVHLLRGIFKHLECVCEVKI